MRLIELNIDKIRSLCRQYKVKTLAVFGSILTDRFNEESDVDFLVNFNDDVTYHTYSDNFFGLMHSLQDLFGREIDLVDEGVIKNRFFKAEVEETKRLIYG